MPAAAEGAAPPTPPEGSTPAPGTGDDISARAAARWIAIILLAVGIILAILINEPGAAFTPKEGFALLTGFYIAAQAIERLLELIPAGMGTKQAKADRAVIFPALGFILAVLMAEKLGLFYVRAIGVSDLSPDWDIIITALAIGGGTKPLHDGIKRIEKAKETPPATT
jgi:hypothetical protein